MSAYTNILDGLDNDDDECWARLGKKFSVQWKKKWVQFVW